MDTNIYVFQLEGRVVVSGGFNGRIRTNTVEVNHHVADEWSMTSRMNEARTNHSMVAVRNKLFVFGGETREVFDTSSRKFATLSVKAPMFESSAFRLEAKLFCSKVTQLLLTFTTN